MTETNQAPLHDFSGRARLFPLPNLVMFPHVVQPLRVFEPRYVSLVEDALRDDQLLSMVLLQPGWEDDYEGRPKIFPVGCLGRILSHTRLEDGTINFLLQGVSRMSVIRELKLECPYRQADVTLLEDLYPASGAPRRTKLRRDLLQWFRDFLTGAAVSEQQFELLANQRLTLGVLTDIVSHSLNLELMHKRQLLEEWNVDLRAERLLERLRRVASMEAMELSPDGFPPPFSRN